MEFAVEATRLLGISLEGSVGEAGKSSAESRAASRRCGHRDPEGRRSHHPKAKCMRSWAKRLGKSTLAQVLAGHPASQCSLGARVRPAKIYST